MGSNKEKVFESDLVFAVWNKGKIIPQHDPIDYRLDYSGNLIQYTRYKTQKDFGWEIGFIIPPENGGDFALSNLIPIEWQNKRRKENLANTLNGVADALKEMECMSREKFETELPELK